MADKKPKYCVVARNRLTKEREVVTGPVSKDDAERIRLNIPISEEPGSHTIILKWNFTPPTINSEI